MESYDFFAEAETLRELAAGVDRRLALLKKEQTLNHRRQMESVALMQSRIFSHDLPGKIEEARSVMRDHSGKRFYDPLSYERAVILIERALGLISAAHTPLALSFNSYRTPFALLSISAIEDDARPERNPFHEYFAEILCERLEREGAGMAGISVAFPGQIQPAYALAYILRRRFEKMHNYHRRTGDHAGPAAAVARSNFAAL